MLVSLKDLIYASPIQRNDGKKIAYIIIGLSLLSVGMFLGWHG